MKIFFGAAIQGKLDRTEKADFNRQIIEFIKSKNGEVIFDHTTGKNVQETGELLEKTIKSLPKTGPERTVVVRNKMIEAIEGDIDGAIFEASIPSLGTGIEIAHAYLRSRIGLKEIPVLILYQKNYWPNKLSTMISGITNEKVPAVVVKEYLSTQEAFGLIEDFLKKLNK